MTRVLLISLISLFHFSGFAQENEIDRWDNWFLLGNKIVFGGEGDFKHSHEVQWRVKDNMQALEQWYYEGVFTYSPTARWEIVPDLRIAVKPGRMDYRPGFGIVRKDYLGKGGNKNQLVQQLKYQFDIDSHGFARHGVRYIWTYSNVINEHLIIGGLLGPFYRWSEKFTGIEFVRGGPTFTYIFDKVHTVSFASLFGAANLGNDTEGNHLGWVYSFTPMVQIIIRVNRDYKYLPAKYINF